jgi:large subunit ribosomal protein L16
MALVLKNLKFKKYKKDRIRLSTNKQTKITFGHFSLKAKEPGRLTSRQIEAGRKLIKKKVKPFGGIIKTKIKLSVPITTKPVSVRMGRGKGKVSFNVSPVKAGTTLYEIYCLNYKEIEKAAYSASHKLPISIKISKRNV